MTAPEWAAYFRQPAKVRIPGRPGTDYNRLLGHVWGGGGRVAGGGKEAAGKPPGSPPGPSRQKVAMAPKPKPAPTTVFTGRSFGPAAPKSIIYKEPAASEAKNIFGREISGKQLASLAGSPDGSRVDVTYDRVNGLRVVIEHKSLDGPMVRTIRREGGQIIIHNDIFKLKLDEQGTNLGLKIFARQVENAQKEGVSHFETNAFRVKGDTYVNKNGVTKEKWAGYYVWPSYGYDGPLKPHQKRNLDADTELPARIKAATRIRQLMSEPAGKDWWRENGGPIDVEFELKPGSYSMETLDKYLQKKLGKV